MGDYRDIFTLIGPCNGPQRRDHTFLYIGKGVSLWNLQLIRVVCPVIQLLWPFLTNLLRGERFLCAAVDLLQAVFDVNLFSQYFCNRRRRSDGSL